MKQLLLKTHRLFACSLLIAFIALTLFGVWHYMDMKMESTGKMTGCLFTGHTAICTMTLPEHLNHWQSLFTAIPQKSAALALLTLIAVLIGAAIYCAHAYLRLLRIFEHSPPLERLYIQQNPEIPLFYTLKEAFSRGILNPKIYNFQARL